MKTDMRMALAAFTSVIAILLLTGCSSHYVAPGPGVTPGALGRTDVSMDRPAPMAAFPARVAVARVQGSGYYNQSVQSYGTGRYSVVTSREVEKDVDVDRLTQLPQLAGLAMLNRIVLPSTLESDRDLRQAAARLGADLLLIYSFDTTFRVKDHEIGPLGVITLGTLPNHEARVTSTCSAALLDVRTGFIYGLAEGTGRKSELSSVWRTSAAVDSARRHAESQAFGALVPEIERMWAGVISQYAASPTGTRYGTAIP